MTYCMNSSTFNVKFMGHAVPRAEHSWNTRYKNTGTEFSTQSIHETPVIKNTGTEFSTQSIHGTPVIKNIGTEFSTQSIHGTPL